MSLNFVFSVGVRSGHHRHPNTVEVAELLHELRSVMCPALQLHTTLLCFLVDHPVQLLSSVKHHPLRTAIGRSREVLDPGTDLFQRY
jgi:hypothetical protein